MYSFIGWFDSEDFSLYVTLLKVDPPLLPQPTSIAWDHDLEEKKLNLHDPRMFLYKFKNF